MAADVIYVANRPSQLSEPGLAAMNAHGWSVRAIYTDTDALASVDPETGARVEWPREFSGSSTLVDSNVDDLRREVVQASDSSSVLVLNGYSTVQLAAVALDRVLRRPEWILRADTLGDRRRSLRPVKRLALRVHTFRGGWVGVVGDHTAAYFQRLGVPCDRMLRMPYLLPEIIHATASGSDGRDLDLMVATKFNRREGGDRILELLKRLVAARPDTRIAVFGVGPLLTDYDRSALPTVSFRGHVRYEEYVSELSRARVFVHLPRIEPWGASIVESLALGTAVVSSANVGAATELAAGGHSVTLVESLDEALEACLRALDQASSRPDGGEELRRRFGGATWVQSIEHFRSCMR